MPSLTATSLSMRRRWLPVNGGRCSKGLGPPLPRSRVPPHGACSRSMRRRRPSWISGGRSALTVRRTLQILEAGNRTGGGHAGDRRK